MLTEVQRAAFERDGILRIPAAFSADDATRMQAVLWAEMRDRYGIERDDRSTWPVGAVVGMKSSKRSKVFAPICGPLVSAALDELFDPSGWRRPDQYGNVLVTFPDTDECRVPHRIWHADHDDACSESQLFAVKVWALCDDVPPGSGGTPLLAGSHRLFARYLEHAPVRGNKATKEGFLASHPWLEALTRDDGGPDRNARLLDVEVDVAGLPARVVEVTGAAGDVVISHGWVYHSIAANAGTAPRLMRGTNVYAANENVF